MSGLQSVHRELCRSQDPTTWRRRLIRARRPGVAAGDVTRSTHARRRWTRGAHTHGTSPSAPIAPLLDQDVWQFEQELRPVERGGGELRDQAGLLAQQHGGRPVVVELAASDALVPEVGRDSADDAGVVRSRSAGVTGAGSSLAQARLTGLS
jgi:hypothetical protein